MIFGKRARVVVAVLVLAISALTVLQQLGVSFR